MNDNLYTLRKLLDDSDIQYLKKNTIILKNLLKLKIQIKRMEICRLLGKGKEIVTIGEKLSQEFDGQGLPTIFSEIYYLLSEGYLILSDYAKIEQSANKAIEFYEKSGDKKGLAFCLDGLGVAYEDTGSPEKGLQYYFSALKIQEEIGDEIGQGESLVNIASCLSVLGRYEESCEFFQKAIAKCTQNGDKYRLAFAYSNFTSLFRHMKKWQEAKKCIETSLQIRREIGDKYGEGFSLSNMGSELMRVGSWSEALRIIKEVVILRENLGEKRFIIYDYLRLGKMLGRLGDYNEAIKNFQKLTSTLKELKLYHEQFDGLIALALVYYYKGEFEKSREYLKEASHCIGNRKDNYIIWCYEGLVFLAENELDKAQETLKKLKENCEDLLTKEKYLFSQLKAKYGIAVSQPKETIKNNFENAVKHARKLFELDQFPLAHILFEYSKWLKTTNLPYEESLKEATEIFKRFDAENWLKKIEML